MKIFTSRYENPIALPNYEPAVVYKVYYLFGICIWYNIVDNPKYEGKWTRLLKNKELMNHFQKSMREIIDSNRNRFLTTQNKTHMERYIGTKIIHAEPLNLGDYNKRRGWTIPENEDPLREGYYVKYEDGYESWSPKEAFEEAYMRTDGMTFGLALEALKKGKMIARSGWNGKNMFVFMQIGNVVSKDFIPKFASLPQSVKDFLKEKGEDVVFHASITMFTAQGTLQPGWLASQTDMLADDWCIVE